MLSVRLLRLLIATVLLTSSLATELPDQWWLLDDDDPFLSLLLELEADPEIDLPDRLRSGPINGQSAPPFDDDEDGASAFGSSTGLADSEGEVGSILREAAPARFSPFPSDGETFEVHPGVRRKIFDTGNVTAPGSGRRGSGESQKTAAARKPSPFPSEGTTFDVHPGLLRPRERTGSITTPSSADSTSTRRSQDKAHTMAPPLQTSTVPSGFGGSPGGPIVFPTTHLSEVEAFTAKQSIIPCSCAPAGSCPGQEASMIGSCGTGHVCCATNRGGYQKCGRIVPKARKNQRVRDSSAPWAAVVLEKVPNGYIYDCGGSLIHPQVVLTAARCVAKDSGKTANLVVRLGEMDLLSEAEPQPHIEILVKEIMIHQNYSYEDKFNDIALLFLEKPAERSERVNTICIRKSIAADDGCTIQAYGLQMAGSDEVDLRLREADQNLLTYIDCQRKLRSSQKGAFFNLHPSFICSESDLTCDLGDDRAGSPLTCPDLEAQEHRLAGLVAWGIGCKNQQKPGVYTSVENFYDWIDYHVTDYFHYSKSYFGFNQV